MNLLCFQEDNVSPLDSDSIDRADPSNTNVYIGNIAPETNEADLVAHFEGGELEGRRLPWTLGEVSL